MTFDKVNTGVSLVIKYSLSNEGPHIFPNISIKHMYYLW